MNPAKLPQAARRITDPKPGESGFAYAHALEIAANGDCYLFGRSSLESKAKMRSMFEVRCDEAGLHVFLPRGVKYAPSEVFEPHTGFVPVASIRVGK